MANRRLKTSKWELQKRSADFLKAVGWMILGAVMAVPISVPLAPWIARKMSNEPVIIMNVRAIQPFKGCSIYMVLLGGAKMAGVKTLEAEFRFAGPITSTVFVSGDFPGPGGSLNQNLDYSLTTSSCTVSAKGDGKLPDNVQASVLGPTHNELMITGHDLTPHSMSTVILAVYPDPSVSPQTAYAFDGRATYLAYGIEVPTAINRLTKASWEYPRSEGN